MARYTLPGILLGLLLQLTSYYIAVSTYEFSLSNCPKLLNFSAFVYLCKALNWDPVVKKRMMTFSFLALFGKLLDLTVYSIQNIFKLEYINSYRYNHIQEAEQTL